ncbi:hypothetical protein PIB30_074320 [Stylosanthes scabra]|uniref:Uncharacterized protein n=1 Tax=Stylosanthes scabra TaxID=79078 RepID=A0ABU6UP09_9FABA|nr:hypothetical protein [Stylosanthes scabra]
MVFAGKISDATSLVRLTGWLDSVVLLYAADDRIVPNWYCDKELVWNEFGWDKASNILFVDQPIGTSFNYTSYDSDTDIRHDEVSVGRDLYDFLQSYAGHYIPALASRVYQGNKAKEGIPINLKVVQLFSCLDKISYIEWALDFEHILQPGWTCKIDEGIAYARWSLDSCHILVRFPVHVLMCSDQSMLPRKFLSRELGNLHKE